MSNLCWKNLEDLECPKCQSTLKQGDKTNGYFCGSCSFNISREKYEDIMSNLGVSSSYYKRTNRVGD